MAEGFVKTNGIPFLGLGAPLKKKKVSGDWDVHWGCGLLTQGVFQDLQTKNSCEGHASGEEVRTWFGQSTDVRFCHMLFLGE